MIRFLLFLMMIGAGAYIIVWIIRWKWGANLRLKTELAKKKVIDEEYDTDKEIIRQYEEDPRYSSLKKGKER